MRRLLPVAMLCPLLIAASAPVAEPTETVDAELARAQAEARAADAKVRRLEQQAGRALNEASRLRVRQAAAAEAISAAEARISAADAEQRIIAARIAMQRDRLERQQQPIASLLAGLAMMARRPPLLALAENSSTDELVRVRLLLDTSMPVIRRRSAALASQLADGERLERASVSARNALARSRDDLGRKRAEFAALEAQALRAAEVSGSAAVGAGDLALASREDLERLTGQAQSERSAASTVRELLALGPVPLRPGSAGKLERPPFVYRLPVDAKVTDGLGEVSASGVRSRGLTLATKRGAPVAVPAPGIVRFSGPFRDYDGIAIIDHGGGWMSLIVNVASEIRPGTKVRAGDALGRALGPLGVELSRNGQNVSPALIAGSSPALSNKGKGG